MSFSIESIAIGDELLTGRIADTNSKFVAQSLFARGLRFSRTTVIPDEDRVIESTLRAAADRSGIAVVFGGLGPTSDDRTARCVADVLGSPLVEHPPARERLVNLYRARNREVTAGALKQVLYPKAARPLANASGLAPGFECAIGKCTFFFLPGVPREMECMWESEVLPRVETLVPGAAAQLLSRTWRCLGIWESQLQQVMDPVEQRLPDGLWLGYRTRFPENHLTLYCQQRTEDSAAQFERFEREIRSVLTPWAYTEQEKDLEELVIERLKEKKQRLALAESATGGLVVHRLSLVPGASEVLWGGVVTYQRAAKQALLDFNLASDEAAVSAVASRELAQRVRRRSGSALSASVTGYSGPAGGTAADPVGTYYLCVDAGGEISEARISTGERTRAENAWGAATYLLQLLWTSVR